MKYKLVGKNDYMLNLEDRIAQNREVDELEDLLYLDEYCTHDYDLLENIQEGCDCLLEHLENDSRIHIIVDSDFDGYTSASLMYLYIKDIYPNTKITYNVHDGKKHGIVLEELEGFEFDLLIVPDGGTNDFEQIKHYTDKEVAIVIVDHHDFSNNYQINKSITINNQDSTYPNKTLVGAAVAYKFCKKLDDILDVNHADKYLDLVATGLVGDMADSRDLETRYYINKGLANIRNPFLKSILKEREFSTKGKINMTTIGFYVCPVINAVTRVGSVKENEDMFKAFIDNKSIVEYNGEEVYFYENTSRECCNIKAKQDRKKKKIVEELIDVIEDRGLDKNAILILPLHSKYESSFTGLISNDMASKYKKPVVTLRRHGDSYLTGSGRCYANHEIKDLRTEVNNSNVVGFAEGHAQAFGIGINKRNLGRLVKYFNERHSTESNDYYDVDFIVNPKDLTNILCRRFTDLIDMYGTNFKEPYIAIEDIYIDRNTVSYNEKRTMIKFSHNGIEFIKFYPTDEDIYNFTKGEHFMVTIVGNVDKNIFRGNTTYQIKINNYECT